MLHKAQEEFVEVPLGTGDVKEGARGHLIFGESTVELYGAPEGLTPGAAAGEQEVGIAPEFADVAYQQGIIYIGNDAVGYGSRLVIFGRNADLSLGLIFVFEQCYLCAVPSGGLLGGRELKLKESGIIGGGGPHLAARPKLQTYPCLRDGADGKHLDEGDELAQAALAPGGPLEGHAAEDMPLDANALCVAVTAVGEEEGKIDVAKGSLELPARPGTAYVLMLGIGRRGNHRNFSGFKPMEI